MFEPGQSQMECDTVHAHSEIASKGVEIFDQSGRYTVVKQSSKGKNYNEMTQNDFIDFEDIKKKMQKNLNKNTNKHTEKWMDIVWYQYRKDDNNHTYFNYNTEVKRF